MKNRKIGTLTLALILIVIGILMLLSSFMEMDVYRIVYYLWPGALILLGLEILVKTVGKNEPVQLHFGAFVLIFLVLIGNAAFFVANDVGIVDKLKQEVNQVEDYLEADLDEIKVDDEIEKIYLDVRADDVVLKSGDDKSISGKIGCYERHVKEEVREIHPKLEMHQSGETMYITISRENNDRRYLDKINLTLPKNVDVCIQGNGSDVTAYLDEFEQMLKLIDIGTVKLYGAENKMIGYQEPRREDKMVQKKNIRSKIDEKTDVIIEKFESIDIID